MQEERLCTSPSLLCCRATLPAATPQGACAGQAAATGTAPAAPHTAAPPKDTKACRGSVGNGEEGLVSVPCVWSHHAPSSTAISHSPRVMIATPLRTRSMPLFPWSSFTTVPFYDVSVLVVVLGREGQSAILTKKGLIYLQETGLSRKVSLQLIE